MNGSPAEGRSGLRSARGFTLVELLVVLVIIAALVLIALPRYFQAVYRSQVRGCQSQIEVISTATQAFFARNKQWPSTLDEMCESTAPSWVVAPPLPEVPLCPFGVPYELVPLLQDGSVGGAPAVGNPQVGVQVNVWDHFDGSWKTAETHIDVK